MDTPLNIYCWRNVLALEPEKVATAVLALSTLFATYTPEQREDMVARITEDREHWIGGRRDAPCTWCYETGVDHRLRPEVFRALENKKLQTKQWHEEYRRLQQDPANVLETEPCHVCKGTKRSREMGMHFGWGMAIRNYLRTHGANETFLGIDNLDDYYVPLIEMALGFAAPEGV